MKLHRRAKIVKRRANVQDLTPMSLQLFEGRDRKSTRLNSSHGYISYAVFCLKKKKKTNIREMAPTRRNPALRPTLHSTPRTARSSAPRSDKLEDPRHVCAALVASTVGPTHTS